jgi:hypothetical protein
MASDRSIDRRVSIATVVAFGALAGLYFASAFRFFAHVEDALISYTYARNFANGYGFVPNIGGERVEGFSNPLWVFLLAGGQLLGVSPFTSSRALGVVLALGELALAYRLYRDHLLDIARESPLLALLAPAVLASQPGFQMWNHMGLENPLYGFLLSLATWLHLNELRGHRRMPWSALPLLGLLLTRPEAPLYVACILGHKVLHLVSARRDAKQGADPGSALGWLALWLALIVVPFAGYVAWRLQYFGWPLPMPYYVKLAEKRSPTVSSLLHGDDPGLQYLGQGIWTMRMVPLVGLGILALVFRRRRPERGACLLLVAQCFAACSFAVYSGGDWMHGWRWLHILIVPLAPLGAAGLVSLADWGARKLGQRPPSVGRAARGVAIGGLFGVVAVWPAATVTPKFAADLPIQGADVRERLDHRTRFAEAFFLDTYSILDGDQGALTYFAPPGVRTFDDVGLNEVATAQHHRSMYSRFFFHEYFFERNRPTFFGPRKSPTSVPKDTPEWSREYTLLPAYIHSRTRKPAHGGWMRKDVFRVNELPPEVASGQPLAFDCGLVLRGARALAQVVDARAPARFEAYWQAPRLPKPGFDYFVELALVDANGNVERKVTRPLLHQAYAVDDWAPEELLRDPEALVPTTQGAHWLTLALSRAPHAAGRDLRSAYGRDPLPVEVPDRGLEPCSPSGATGAGLPLRVASVNVDPGLAAQVATQLEAQISGAALADGASALTQIVLVLGPEAERVRAARRDLAARVHREELAVGQHLLQAGQDREAADHLLRARAEDVRDPEVNSLLAAISARVQASATARLASAESREQTCSAYRSLLDAVTIYPQNSRARRLAETERPQCWSVLSQVDFGVTDDDGVLRPDNGRRVFPPGQRLGLRLRWRNSPNLESTTLPLEARAYGPDGSVVYRRTVIVTSEHGEATVAWPFDTVGHWRVEATLEGRLEASVGVDIETAP